MTRIPSCSLVALALVAALPLDAAAEAPAGPAPIPLAEALQQLDAQSLTLAQARGRAEEAQSMVRQAMAGFLPTAAVGVSYVRNNEGARLSLSPVLDSIEGGLQQATGRPIKLDRTNVPAAQVIQPLEAFTGSANVRVPLFAANQFLDWKAAKEVAGVSAASMETVRLQLRAALVQAAWGSGAAEDIAAASERALAIAQEHERSAARNVEAGIATPLSHLQAQTEVVRRESDVARTRSERERAWLAVGVLLGRAEPVRVALPGGPASIPMDPEALIKDAVGRRPELRAQDAAVRAGELQLDSALWRHAPQLSAGFTFLASDVPFVTGEQIAWKASVDLSWTLYDGGFRYGKRDQAQAQIATNKAALAAQRIEISQQVRDATRDVSVAEERLRLAIRQKELAQEVYGSAKRSFEAGLASSLDVLDANDRLYQADVGLADARARLGMARVSLERATGALL
ncbi:MAG TPA: TolC family protein [Myxococcales bacterium]|jgi:outer membrane protein TolC